MSTTYRHYEERLFFVIALLLLRGGCCIGSHPEEAISTLSGQKWGKGAKKGIFSFPKISSCGMILMIESALCKARDLRYTIENLKPG